VFTGLVASLGRVRSVERAPDGIRLEIASECSGDLAPGDSVSVSGVCLTATQAGADTFVAEVMNETLDRSSLARVSRGDELNLELPLRAADRLGGHVVQGHVDGVGTIVGAHEDGFSRRLEIAAAPEVLRYLVGKGSVAVDGVSLTVVDVGESSFDVALIPETLQRTTLGKAIVGATVNLEVDILAKYVERLMAVLR
jgi:riboflavin synthase